MTTMAKQSRKAKQADLDAAREELGKLAAAADLLLFSLGNTQKAIALLVNDPTDSVNLDRLCECHKDNSVLMDAIGKRLGITNGEGED